MNKMPILVTGSAGYVGSVLIRELLKRGYKVRGIDRLLFGGESLLGVYGAQNFDFLKGDIRSEEDIFAALKDIKAVLHLAAIVGDPACSKQPTLARETNWEGSKLLFDMCVKNANVKRFVFASTCSNYGKMNNERYVNEDSPLHPLSLYADLKVNFEKYLLESSTRSDFVPTALRFGTVYGLSPRMRFDLTVNEFVRELTLGRTLKVYGPQFWRPYIHVEDAARAYIHVLENDPQKVDHNVFNVGDTAENYQKKMIIDEIMKIIPNAQVQFYSKDQDPRNFRVDFSKITTELHWKISKTLRDGVEEIHNALKDGIISEPYAAKYREA